MVESKPGPSRDRVPLHPKGLSDRWPVSGIEEPPHYSPLGVLSGFEYQTARPTSGRFPSREWTNGPFRVGAGRPLHRLYGVPQPSGLPYPSPLERGGLLEPLSTSDTIRYKDGQRFISLSAGACEGLPLSKVGPGEEISLCQRGRGRVIPLPERQGRSRKVYPSEPLSNGVPHIRPQ